MGFININGQQVHTSSISTTGVVGSAGITGSITTTSGQGIVYSNSAGTFNISANKSTYHILDEDFEVEGWHDANLAIIIATINVLGRPFYEQLKKQSVSLPESIDNFIKKRLSVIERDEKIDKIITNKS